LASAVHPVSAPAPTRTAFGRILRLPGLFVVTMGALLLHGYHPYIVDASIYLVGIEKNIDPALFPRDNALVLAHAHLSIFSILMASMVRALHLSLPVLLFAVYIGLLLFLFALCYKLGERVFHSSRAGWGAALLMAVCMPVPVAATSLLLIDPYLSSRSFSTDLALLALLASIDNRWTLALLSCAATIAFHPLMGAYLAIYLLIHSLVQRQRWRLVAVTCTGALILCGAIALLTLHTSVTTSYREAVLGRSYYFLADWKWFEIAGLLMPLLLLGITARYAGVRTPLGRLAATCVLVGGTSVVCCACFVHPAGPYFLTRLQLLRTFHILYALGVVMLGGAAAKLCRGRRQMAWLGLLGIVGLGMLLLQRREYRSLPDVEWPGAAVTNPWERGLFWVRGHTPDSALFAMDPQLMFFDDDAIPGFRVIAQRSILTDIKDEGLASLFPPLAPVWAKRLERERGLDEETDAQRRAKLSGTGVQWLLLSPSAATSLPCPYHNMSLKVCFLGTQKAGL
jgi:hypothetical protein